MKLGYKLILAIVLSVSLTVPAFAQTQFGRIIGRVTDPSDAIVPDATISALSPVTGATSESRSNGEGYYVLPSLQYGHYNVNVTKAGFAPYRVEGVEVASSTDTTLNVKLSVTTSATSIEVNAAPVLLQTQEPSIAVNVEDKLMRDAPIPVSGNARTASQYMLLSPTVQYVNGNTTAAGGGRMWSMSVMQDGLPTDSDASMQTNGMSYEPSVESIGEYKMIVNSAPAEYGRQGGAVLAYASKSGTNSLHGSVFDYLAKRRAQRAVVAGNQGAGRSQ